MCSHLYSYLSPSYLTASKPLLEYDNLHFRPQDHYDWGLRAIKSVLVVAGSLKRSDRTRPEEQVLMRALRDFNIPKIVTDDLPVFMGLIGDLFPAMDVPRKRDLDLEATVKQSALVRILQIIFVIFFIWNSTQAIFRRNFFFWKIFRACKLMCDHRYTSFELLENDDSVTEISPSCP